MTSRLEQLYLQRGLRMSDQRRVILRVLDAADDHPSADEVYRRAIDDAPGLSVATVYRTLNLLAEAGLLSRLAIGDRKPRYEVTRPGHHDHLIDTRTGGVHEFRNDEITALLTQIAARLGYRLLDYRLALFGGPQGEERDARHGTRAAGRRKPDRRQALASRSGAAPPR